MLMDLYEKLYELIVGPRPKSLRARPTERELIHEESRVGRDIFGPPPNGRRREFFCLDEKTWIWHEEWADPFTGQKQSSTIRYEIRANGVLKTRDNDQSLFIEGEELNNLVVATRTYFERVVREVYRYDPHTGLPLQQQAPALQSWPK